MIVLPLRIIRNLDTMKDSYKVYIFLYSSKCQNKQGIE